VPAQQRLRPNDQQCLPPGADPTSEEHQERAIRRRHGWARDVAAQHDHLLAKEGILGEQLRPTPQEIRAGHCGMRRRWPRPEEAVAAMP